MKTTAIIAKDHSDFKEFVKKLDSGGFYIFVDSIYKTRGIEFSEVIITDNVEQKGSFFELYNACKLRVRSDKKYNTMAKDYIIATELWISIQKIQIEQDKESFEANEKQIKLLMQENNLLKKKIIHQTEFTNTTEVELNQYKEEN